MPHWKLFKTDSWEYGHDTPAHEEPLEAPKKRRLLTTAAFAVMLPPFPPLVRFSANRALPEARTTFPLTTNFIAHAEFAPAPSFSARAAPPRRDAGWRLSRPAPCVRHSAPAP